MITEVAEAAFGSAHCRRCGLMALAERCSGCEAPIELAADAASLPAETLCAVVRVEMPCRVCGLQMPVNHLPIDGKLRCLHCARIQAPADDAFDALVRTAHGIVDMAAEAGPYVRLGVEEAAITQDVAEGSALIGPGVPRCFLCSAALNVTLDAERGVVVTTCSSCGDRAGYASVRRSAWRGLVGVIAPEHRIEQQPVKRSVEGAVVALNCPKCGGPLDPNPRERLVQCNYCDTKSLVLEETWALLEGAPKKQPWYLLLRGPSELRRELDDERQRVLRRQEAERNKQRKAQERSAQRANARTDRRTKVSWYQENRSLVAGLSSLVSGFACCALIIGGTYAMGFDEQALPAGFISYFVVVVIGIVLQGKGKIADMPPKTATRVFNASVMCFLASIAAFLIMLTLAGQ